MYEKKLQTETGPQAHKHKGRKFLLDITTQSLVCAELPLHLSHEWHSGDADSQITQHSGSTPSVECLGVGSG